MNDTLFPLPDAIEPHGEVGNAEPRVQRPNRTQLEWRPVDLEARLAADHRGRVVWDFVAGLDLRPLYQAIKAVEGHAGRPPIDPAILMALWLYATLEGVGSAAASTSPSASSANPSCSSSTSRPPGLPTMPMATSRR